MQGPARLFVTGFVIASTLLYCNKDSDRWDLNVPETAENPTTSEIKGFIFQPALAPASDQNISQLKVPAGFTVSKFADALLKPRINAVNWLSGIYVSDRDAGTVTLVSDRNSDGVAENKVVVAKINQAHGLAIKNSKLYIATLREI